MMVVLLVLLYHHNILRFFDFTIIIMVGFRVHGHIYNALSMIQNDATGSCAHAHMRTRSSTYIRARDVRRDAHKFACRIVQLIRATSLYKATSDQGKNEQPKGSIDLTQETRLPTLLQKAQKCPTQDCSFIQ